MNRLHEKKKIGSTKRVTHLAHSPSYPEVNIIAAHPKGNFFKQFIPLLTSDRSLFSRLSVLQLFVDLYYNITTLHPGICMAV